MEKVLLILLSFFVSVSYVGGQDHAPDSRDVVFTFANKKGRPVSGIIVQATNGKSAGISDPSGKFWLRNVTDQDSVIIVFPRQGPVTLSLNGVDSVAVKVEKSGRGGYGYSASYDNKLVDVGYGNVRESSYTHSASTINVEEMVKHGNYTRLSDLLVGRIAGLEITGPNTARIRGSSSFMSNTEPIVVIDGFVAGNFSTVNSTINLHDISTISVLKDGTGYGVRGANGVIVITTKKGGKK